MVSFLGSWPFHSLRAPLVRYNVCESCQNCIEFINHAANFRFDVLKEKIKTLWCNYLWKYDSCCVPVDKSIRRWARCNYFAIGSQQDQVGSLIDRRVCLWWLSMSAIQRSSSEQKPSREPLTWKRKDRIIGWCSWCLALCLRLRVKLRSFDSIGTSDAVNRMSCGLFIRPPWQWSDCNSLWCWPAHLKRLMSATAICNGSRPLMVARHSRKRGHLRCRFHNVMVIVISLNRSKEQV